MIRRLPSFSGNVKVKDFGIRGYDLAYTLLEDYDVTILVDAAPRGGEPGTLYVIEPEISDHNSDVTIDAHAMNPVSVLRMARSLGPIPSRILLVACEPADLGGDEGRMELSGAVSAAIDEGVRLVEKLVAENSGVVNGNRADTNQTEIDEDRDSMLLFGGAALMLLGAGLLLSSPIVRRYLNGVNLPALLRSAAPDLERFLDPKRGAR